MADSSNRSGGDSPGSNLYHGKRMAQEEFHLSYDQMPDNYRAELIGGVVCEPSPLGLPHGTVHPRLSLILGHYAIRTTGTQIADNVTVILSNSDEVQPDVILRIMPEYGGQSKNLPLRSRKYAKPIPYVKGAPELVAEVAHSSRDKDLHMKKGRYTFAGVCEYIVVCLDPERVHWFDLKNHRKLKADGDGVFRSEVFPGLWIHGNALLKLDGELSMNTLNKGLKSKEHREFVRKLADAKL